MLPIPVLHGVAALTAFLVGNAAVTAVVMVQLSVLNLWFLILVLPAYRHREDPVAEVSNELTSCTAKNPMPLSATSLHAPASTRHRTIIRRSGRMGENEDLIKSRIVQEVNHLPSHVDGATLRLSCIAAQLQRPRLLQGIPVDVNLLWESHGKELG